MTKDFNEIEHFLYNLKLGKYEARAYLTLLKHGPQDYNGLIELSNVPYGQINAILKSLIKKGWVKTPDQRSQTFCAMYPETPLRKYLMNMKKFYLLTTPF